MGSKGSSRHKKRLSAPVPYTIMRKHGKFTIRTHPTRAVHESSIPLGVVVREMLGYANNLREVKRILSRKLIRIDGKIQSSYKFGIGPMDIIEIPKTEETFRFTPYKGKRRFRLHPITKEEANWKLLRIHRKQTAKQGKIQLTFHDGRNLFLDPAEDYKFQISDLSIKDTVKFNLENRTIEAHYPFAEGNTAIIMGGHNIGLVGKIRAIETQVGRRSRSILLQTAEGEITTTDTHLFMIGYETPVIEIPETDGEENNES
ncbi:MAG: 30S ribosomal protein S4e [Candidatus Heimdallarchaeota archaeon]|nr:30S ribosomal protein S4e [Candidatus Heimdallarchaeota archaeon]